MSKKHDVMLTTAQIQHIRAALREYSVNELQDDQREINRELVHGLWDVVCNDVIFSGVKQ
jgi:hypothetical protein